MSTANRKLFNNIVYAFSAQGISLVLSVMMSLIVPQALGVEQYSYWQLFLFYNVYVNIFHFGISDGVYLRVGGKEYSELNHSLIGAQIKLGMLVQSVIAVLIVMVGLTVIQNPDRLFVLGATSIYMIVYNANVFIGYIFQAVNQTKVYSVSIIINKFFFILAVISLLLLQVDSYRVFIALMLVSEFIVLGFLIYKGKALIFTHTEPFRNVWKEVKVNVSVGMKLMLSGVAAGLVIGVGRLITDNVWGITTFGKFSFALSLTNFFLLFIMQLSMVLFPALRQSDEKSVKKFYHVARTCLSLFLPAVLLGYYPIKQLLSIWLPQYQESLGYLALLLPLCTFDGKMQLLCNTFLKVYRKENKLLLFNVMSVAVSLVLSLMAAYLFHNVYLILVVMVIAVAFRSIVSELYLSALMGEKVLLSIVQECILVSIFMGASWYIEGVAGFLTYGVAFLVYLAVNNKKILSILDLFRTQFKKKKPSVSLSSVEEMN